MTTKALPTIVFATGNEHKFAEVKEILKDVFIVEQHDIDLPEIQGTAEEIAREKSNSAVAQLKRACLIEDSSLCFDAMGDLPGPYIKWFLKSLGLVGLNKMLAEFEKDARARCIFAYCEGPGHEPELFSGEILGKIVPARGSTRFGWDAIFEPNDYNETFGEMNDETKNSCSHRRRALDALKKHFASNASVPPAIEGTKDVHVAI